MNVLPIDSDNLIRKFSAQVIEWHHKTLESIVRDLGVTYENVHEYELRQYHAEIIPGLLGHTSELWHHDRHIATISCVPKSDPLRFEMSVAMARTGET